MSIPPFGFPAKRTPELLRNLLSDLKSQADTARVEAITGRVQDAAETLGGRVREPLELERDLSDISEFRQIIAIAETRTVATQAAIGNLRTLNDELANQATVALQSGGLNGLETLSSSAYDSLKSAVSSLNTAIGGRAIFAGDAGDQRALADADTILAEVTAILEAAPDAATGLADVEAAFNTPGGLFETTLYTGGTGDAPEAEIDEGERVAYQTRADAQGFRDLIRGFAVLAASYDPNATLTDDTRRGIADGALPQLRNAVDPLNREAARIGVAEARIETVKARHVATETALSNSLNDLTGADPLTAATRLQELEGQLEVLFLTNARLNQLSLSNFLR